jgi:universal stress protein A
MELSKILVGIDFSPDSGRALALAGDLARGCGAEVLLLHVFEFARGLRTDALDNARRQLDGWLAVLRERALPGRGILRPGEPAKEILSVCELERSGLIVLGTHGCTATSSLLLGSVADRVVRRASAPVLLVRHPERAVLPLAR